jgi:hypothetical protein
MNTKDKHNKPPDSFIKGPLHFIYTHITTFKTKMRTAVGGAILAATLQLE